MWAWRVFLLVTAIGITLLVLGSVANRAYPKGPKIPTGVYECANDGRGPCGEVYEEDIEAVRHLLPTWAYTAREHGFLNWGIVATLIGVVGMVTFSLGARRQRREETLRKKWWEDFRRVHGRDPTPLETVDKETRRAVEESIAQSRCSSL